MASEEKGYKTRPLLRLLLVVVQQELVVVVVVVLWVTSIPFE